MRSPVEPDTAFDKGSAYIKMHSIEPTVAEKILKRPDRAQIEAELTNYPHAQQKRWVANPLLEWLLQSFQANLTRGAGQGPVGSPSAAVSGAAGAAGAAETGKVKATMKEDIKEDSDEEGAGFFGMFD